MALCPQLFGGGRPVIGVRLALIVEVLYVLRGLHIRGVRACSLHHVPELFGVLQHGARPEHIVVEGLAVVVGHEQGALIGVQQPVFPDIGIRIVDEGAGLDIPVGVDVEIALAPGDAAPHELTVVLEVKEKAPCIVFIDEIDAIGQSATAATWAAMMSGSRRSISF